MHMMNFGHRFLIKYYQSLQLLLWSFLFYNLWFEIDEILTLKYLVIAQMSGTIDFIYSVSKLTCIHKMPAVTIAIQLLFRIYVIILCLSLYINKNLPALSFYITMYSWTTNEIIKYLYYLFPRIYVLKYMKYTAFIMLYPLGITGELLLIEFFYRYHQHYEIVIIGFLCVYYLSFPRLFIYLLKQRHKELN